MVIHEEAPEEQDEPQETLSYKDLPEEVTTTLDKLVFQLDLLSKTIIGMEKRVGLSEDKMGEVLHYFKNLDTRGNVRETTTEKIIDQTTIVKNMTTADLKKTVNNTLRFQERVDEGVKVMPHEQVDEDFMRSTNVFVKYNQAASDYN